MTVYVESNFLLAIALAQEDTEPATAILALAEQGRLDIAFPALAVSEPFSTVSQRGRERRRLRSSLNEQVRQLGRSNPHQRIVATLRPIPVMRADIEQAEIALLSNVCHQTEPSASSARTGRTLAIPGLWRSCGRTAASMPRASRRP